MNLNTAPTLELTGSTQDNGDKATASFQATAKHRPVKAADPERTPIALSAAERRVDEFCLQLAAMLERVLEAEAVKMSAGDGKQGKK